MPKLTNRLVYFVALSVIYVCLLVAWSSNTAMAESHLAFIELEKLRELPARGQSQTTVRKRYGEPLESRSAIGRPPISSWLYEDFTVYFEIDRVITTVAIEDKLPVKLKSIQ